MDPSTDKARQPTPALNFRRRQRLAHALEFASVFEARVRKVGGPLIVFGAPNDLGFTRLGLSVGRRVGNAVVRNRVKRRLREAFRLDQHEMPMGYDLVVTVRGHDPLPLAAYRRLLLSAATGLHTEWTRRQRRDDGASETEVPRAE